MCSIPIRSTIYKVFDFCLSCQLWQTCKQTASFQGQISYFYWYVSLYMFKVTKTPIYYIFNFQIECLSFNYLKDLKYTFSLWKKKLIKQLSRWYTLHCDLTVDRNRNFRRKPRQCHLVTNPISRAAVEYRTRTALTRNH